MRLFFGTDCFEIAREQTRREWFAAGLFMDFSLWRERSERHKKPPAMRVE
jgi:hypothetical protein